MRRILSAVLLFVAPNAIRAPIEHGTLVLHMEMNPIGTERYEIAIDERGRTLTTTFGFTDRGHPDTTRVMLRVTASGVPDTFDLRRDAPPTPEVHVSVGRPERAATFFTVSGYAPFAVQQEMVRYWNTHGRPDTLPLRPSGAATITYEGRETIKAGARSVAVSRYTVGGVVWGSETLWLDSAMRLVGAVTNEAGGNHFEVVREEYEGALGTLVAEAASANMARLTRLSAPQSPRAPNSQPLALVGGTLIDGSGAPPVNDAVVLVRGDRVIAAGPRATVDIPLGARRVDVSGRYILPGLWDMHAHYSQVEWGPAYLAAGVTTVRDVGNEFEFIRQVRDIIRSGQGVGPRILVAGFFDGDSPAAIGVRRARDPDQVRGLVREYKAADFQQIKIYNSVPRALVAVITAEAHRLGMTVTGHVPVGMTVYDAVGAGMDQINHATFIASMMGMFGPRNRPVPGRPIDVTTDSASRAIRFLVDHHTVVDPTLAVFEIQDRPAEQPISAFEPGIATLPPQLARAIEESGLGPADTTLGRLHFQTLSAAVSALHRAGVPIVAGTDQVVPGHSLHRELELYVRAGFTPMEAIQSATLVPARAMGVDAESGTVAAGKRADLIVVDGDPLADIANIRRIRVVVANGRLYDPSALDRSIGFRPLASLGRQ